MQNEQKFNNKLIHETSPYLLQHAHNPVNWYPWGEEALSLSKAHDKPIFLSIGYSACHWCHVMEQESFENEEIAHILNEHFICIKVDREERPDIDEIYMNAVQLMIGNGGWPLSVWLTPDQAPFFGGTYFPPEDRWGRMGFKNVLLQVIEVWHEKRDQLMETANQVSSHLKQMNQIETGNYGYDINVWVKAFDSAHSNFDDKYGGFGKAPKFPHAMELSFLLRYYFHTQETRALAIVEKTLQNMAKGGIFDQLGGGFHRYATDDYWLVPHFEKMLYDNALLATTYIEAYQLTMNKFYSEVARSTLEYVLREMTSADGGFYSSQDADSEGEEGKYFVWSKAEIDSILNAEETSLFCDFYDVTSQGNWEGVNILHQSKSIQDLVNKYEISGQSIDGTLRTARNKLFKRRLKRVPPATDDKILSSWNGLMISALCKGFQVLGEDKFLTAAQAAVDFIQSHLLKDGSLLRTYRAGKSQYKGYLSDYAFLAAALIDLYESTFDLAYLEKAIELNKIQISKFWDKVNGGFYFTASDHEQLLLRTRKVYDSAVPSGNSVAVNNMLRLSIITGDDKLRRKAEQTIKLYAKKIQSYTSGVASLLSSFDFFWGNPKEIVVAGDRTSKNTSDLITSIYRFYLPNKILVYADPVLLHDHSKMKRLLPLVDGKISTNRESKMYVCENYTCKTPFTSSEEFVEFYDALSHIKERHTQ